MSIKAVNHPPSQLQEFQQNYSRHLRNPQEYSLPEGIPARRSRVYEELLFNNVRGFVDRCFPVARQLLNKSEWEMLSRHFYREWRCDTPYFSRIPHEFVQFVKQAPELRPWLAELVDYEWRELEADLHPAAVPRVHLSPDGDHPLQLNPTLQNLHYQWQVHRISPGSIPDQPQPALLVVYRNFEHRVQFMEVNTATSVLLQLLQEGAQSPQSLLDKLAENLPHIPRSSLLEFGRPLLHQLLMQNVLLIEQPVTIYP